MLGLQPDEPCRLARPDELGLCRFRQLEVVRSMPLLDGLRLATLSESGQGVLPDCLQHPDAHLPARQLLLPEEAAVDERDDAFEHIRLPSTRAYGLTRLDRAASR